MFARVSRFSGESSALRSGFDSVAAELERLDGFGQAFFLTDDDGHGMSVTLWDSRDALQQSANAANDMRQRATTQAHATIDSVETFEVVLTVKAGSGVR